MGRAMFLKVKISQPTILEELAAVANLLTFPPSLTILNWHHIVSIRLRFETAIDQQHKTAQSMTQATGAPLSLPILGSKGGPCASGVANHEKKH